MNLGIYLIFLPFVLIGVVMAYLITYSEYRHHYPTKKEPRRMALEAAIFTFVFFAIMGFLIAYVFIRWIQK